MAARGAKPKPIKLRLVDGTHNTTRHGKLVDAQQKAEVAATSFGKLMKPANLKGESAKAWKRYIEPAGWLDGSREPAAIRFCQLWGEAQMNPMGFPASKDGQMRAYMSELGLTDERNRGGQGPEERDEHFDD